MPIHNLLKEKILTMLSNPCTLVSKNTNCAGDSNGPQNFDHELIETPHERFSDIACLEEAKSILFESIVLPSKLPHLFVGVRSPWKGLPIKQTTSLIVPGIILFGVFLHFGCLTS
jgi:SpoVK/Ycf46/Vps4 family AAA+-type ATPase